MTNLMRMKRGWRSTDSIICLGIYRWSAGIINKYEYYKSDMRDEEEEED